MAILVTGVAGFVGMHVAQRLLAQGKDVVGIDSLSDLGEHASVRLKRDRLASLTRYPDFQFIHLDLTNGSVLDACFGSTRFSHVIHLAAQTGVRYSLQNPHAYVMSNVVGFSNMIESCRKHEIAHLVYASSSSIYGANREMPFSEHHHADHPISVYAATKRCNELIAHSYSHLYQLPTTGLRFFTVYGPWGRPDMAPMLFAEAILSGRPIEVFNGGRMLRDFTFVDDVVESILRVMVRPALPNLHFDARYPDPATSYSPFRIYNVGNQQPVDLNAFIGALETALGRKAKKIERPMQAGDVVATFADTRELVKAIQWMPTTPLKIGIERFVTWLRSYREQCNDDRLPSPLVDSAWPHGQSQQAGFSPPDRVMSDITAPDSRGLV